MKIAFHTLGCKVNQYESEAIAAAFEQQGYTVVDEREFADVYVINTCTVTAVADKKSRQYIRRMKKVNPDSVVVVTGCYAQISPEEVSAVDGVDIVAGTNDADMVLAGNTVRKNKGGLAFALNGQVVGELPLPVAGLMSTGSAEAVEEKLQALKAALKAHGISEDIDAFMTLAFVSLPVIPKLRLNTYGIVDVEAQQIVPAVF